MPSGSASTCALLCSDLLEGLRGEPFEVVLSNPPYVADGERAALAPEITRHEPALALYAGADGLDVIRRLIDEAAARPDVRRLALEVGDGQAGAVAALAERAGFATARCALDLAGVARVVVAER